MQSKQATQRLQSIRWFFVSMQEALQRLPQRAQLTHLLVSIVGRKREKRERRPRTVTHNVYIYIAIVALTTYLVRVLPLTLIRREIKNQFIRSFLFYVPYVTLAAMTFPAIVTATHSVWSGVAALAVGAVIAWVTGNLFLVASSACAVVFLAELILVRGPTL